MADYISNYTGTEIESAVTTVLNGPSIDDTVMMYAIGSPSTGPNQTILKKSNIKFVDAGGIDCTNITCSTFVTKNPLQLKQSNTSVPEEGGQVDFYDTTGVQQGSIDLHYKATPDHWFLRMFKPGTELLNLDLTDGHLTVCNRARDFMWITATKKATFISPYSRSGSGAVGHLSMKSPTGAWSLCTYDTNSLHFVFGTDANYNSNTNTTVRVYINASGVFYGAGYNDYAETRKVTIKKPGTCIYELGNGTMEPTYERLQRGCKIISDTFGFTIGPNEEENKEYSSIAVSGRVLAYIHEGREEAAKHIGWPVCSGPDGTVSIMTEEEEQKYPSRIVGTISEIPTYEVWSEKNVQVDGRIWIYVR